jgi:hypothetical protein
MSPVRYISVLFPDTSLTIILFASELILIWQRQGSFIDRPIVDHRQSQC